MSYTLTDVGVFSMEGVRQRRQPACPIDAGPVSSSGNRLDFREAWSDLRAAGWFAKPPPRRSLDERYRYVCPGGNPDGEEGEDYFLGKHNLLLHYSSVLKKTVPENVNYESSGAKPLRYYDSRIDKPQQDADHVENRDDTCNDIEGGGHYEVVCGDSVLDVSMIDVDGLVPVLADSSGKAAHTQPVRKEASFSRSIGPVMEERVCAVCKSSCSTKRWCTNCGEFLHHFCSHDVCAQLDLYNSDEERLLDFGDCSYCSKVCYDNATTTSGMTASNKTNAAINSCVDHVVAVSSIRESEPSSVDSSYHQETTKKRLAAPKLKRTASSQETASEKSKQKSHGVNRPSAYYRQEHRVAKRIRNQVQTR
ncbi:hypothetical protein PC123_g25959 [Phytophthora cactorum]|nr:hypothetical protein PC123_g25959 [Phytophthora cactorum]